MKPTWSQTLAWVAAVLAAVVLAFTGPDVLHFSPFHAPVPQGGAAPR